MATVSEHVPFLHLCKLCQKLSDKKGKDKKIKPLTDFIEYWRSFHLKLHSENPNTMDSFFSAMRLLLPQCERQRAAYGIKEFTLAKLLIEIFCLDKNSVDAQKLINYRSPKSSNAEAGDFASVAYFVLKNRSPENGSLTIYDVNHYLDSIATNHAEKNKDEVKQDLLHLLRNLSALEQKWLIRVILKDMKLGISENTVLSSFHQDARDLYNVSNSLEKVCLSLKDPAVRLHEIEIELFSPFRPMLSEMALPNQVENLMKCRHFIVETKYDGERLQLHKHGSSYMYFSRGGFDCTNTYGSSPLQGTLTPFIHRAFNTGIQKCVLDGEIVIYSNKLNCIVSKGENADVQALQPDGDYAPCFCVFDILLLNGDVLTNRPLTERSAIIRDAFTQIDNKIRYSEQKHLSTNAEVSEELNKAIDGRLEGIVVKRPDSVYRPNIRKGGGWLKVKPEYIENLMDELDLLIIGGYYGEGRRANMISHFLMAVASTEQMDGSPKCFYSFCKVGSGYTFRELHELSGKLEENWQKYDTRRPPHHLIIGGGRKEQPDLWIEPHKSQILQVKAFEINGSKSFATHCTLRFPRVEKIRYDKPWTDCMTMDELDHLRNMAQGRLATRHSTGQDEEEAETDPSPKKRQRLQNTVTVAPHFRPTDVRGLEQVSQLFKDKEMCILFASLQKKADIERKITQHGGKFVQNPGGSTWCVVCDRVTAKVRNMMNTGLYNIVKEQWVYRCIQQNSLLKWTPNDLIQTTDDTAKELGKFFDKFGDSYTEDLTELKLGKIFASISDTDWKSVHMDTAKMAETDQMCFPNGRTSGLFRNCRMYLAAEKVEGFEPSTLLSLQLRLHGAQVCTEINESITHVVIPSRNPLSNKELHSMGKGKETAVVAEQWVLDCIAAGKVLSHDSVMDMFVSTDEETLDASTVEYIMDTLVTEEEVNVPDNKMVENVQVAVNIPDNEIVGNVLDNKMVENAPEAVNVRDSRSKDSFDDPASEETLKASTMEYIMDTLITDVPDTKLVENIPESVQVPDSRDESNVSVTKSTINDFFDSLLSF